MAQTILAVDIYHEAAKAVDARLEAILEKRNERERNEEEVERIQMALMPQAITVAIESYEGRGYRVEGKRWLNTLIAACDVNQEAFFYNEVRSDTRVDDTLQRIQDRRLERSIRADIGTAMHIEGADPLGSSADSMWAYGAGNSQGNIYAGIGRNTQTGELSTGIAAMKADMVSLKKDLKQAFSKKDFGQQHLGAALMGSSTTTRQVDPDNVFKKMNRRYVARNQTYELDVDKTLREAGVHTSFPGYSIIRERLESEKNDPPEKDRLIQLYAQAQLELDE